MYEVTSSQAYFLYQCVHEFIQLNHLNLLTGLLGSSGVRIPWLFAPFYSSFLSIDHKLCMSGAHGLSDKVLRLDNVHVPRVSLGRVDTKRPQHKTMRQTTMSLVREGIYMVANGSPSLEPEVLSI